jgi:hypothetical protein
MLAHLRERKKIKQREVRVRKRREVPPMVRENI